MQGYIEPGLELNMAYGPIIPLVLFAPIYLESPLKSSGRRWETAFLLEAIELAQYAKYLSIERIRPEKNFYLKFEA